MPAQGMWTGLTWALLLTSFTATSSKQYAFHMWAIVRTAIQSAMQILARRLQATETQIWQYKLHRNVTLLRFRYRHSDTNGNLKPLLHNLFKAGLLDFPVLYKLLGGGNRCCFASELAAEVVTVPDWHTVCTVYKVWAGSSWLMIYGYALCAIHNQNS